MVATAAACLLDIKDEGQNPPTRARGRFENLGDSGASSTAIRKLQRLPFSTSSSFVKI